MKLTLSVIKADIGSVGGQFVPHGGFVETQASTEERTIRSHWWEPARLLRLSAATSNNKAR